MLERPVASLYSGFCQTPKSLKSILEPILQILETMSVGDVIRQAGTLLPPATSDYTRK